ncbi:MAG: ATP-binding cassette domain-containing protein [Rickettsiales bacterium]|jgi:Fe-S cluster assembly ATP-binding protein|nr:ATP-binding cassette domain-containing protein [Rickettsiales bacterium]
MLEIKNMNVSFGDKELLHDINMTVTGRTLLRGANGSGKTTLVHAISSGIPTAVGGGCHKVAGGGYIITSGEIIFDGKNITGLPTDARARLGIFIGAQNVPEIPGLTLMSFIKHAIMARNPEIKMGDILKQIADARAKLNIPESWMARSVNVGFSGGERKRIMFLMLLLLQPRVAILDEPDSGADAAAQKLFASIINEMTGTEFLIISHQEKFAEQINPTQIVSLDTGRIVV